MQKSAQNTVFSARASNALAQPHCKDNFSALVVFAAIRVSSLSNQMLIPRRRTAAASAASSHHRRKPIACTAVRGPQTRRALSHRFAPARLSTHAAGAAGAGREDDADGPATAHRRSSNRERFRVRPSNRNARPASPPPGSGQSRRINVGEAKRPGELTYITSKDAYIWAGIASLITQYASRGRNFANRQQYGLPHHAWNGHKLRPAKRSEFFDDQINAQYLAVDREGTAPTGENAAQGVAALILERDALRLTRVGCDTASLATSARFDAERDLRPLVDVASGSAWAGTDAVGGITLSGCVFGLRPRPSSFANIDRRSE